MIPEPTFSSDSDNTGLGRRNAIHLDCDEPASEFVLYGMRRGCCSARRMGEGRRRGEEMRRLEESASDAESSGSDG